MKLSFPITLQLDPVSTTIFLCRICFIKCEVIISNNFTIRSSLPYYIFAAYFSSKVKLSFPIRLDPVSPTIFLCRICFIKGEVIISNNFTIRSSLPYYIFATYFSSNLKLSFPITLQLDPVSPTIPGEPEKSSHI